MAVTYKKLWKLLIDKEMKKSDLEKKAHISHYSLGQMSKGKDVSTETLSKICKALECNIEEIIEIEQK